MDSFSNNKKMFFNVFSNVLVFGITVLINLGLSPIIVSSLGVEANGFVQLANNFVSYATLISIALNSMSSRFITIEMHKGDFKKANEYYSSTFAGNLLILFLMIIPVIFLIDNLEMFIEVSSNIYNQVQTLFVFIFINYFLTICFPLWNVAFFATNKVYLQSLGNILSNSMRAFILITLFSIFPAKIWYIGLASVLGTIVLQIWQFYGKRKVLPDVLIKIKYIKFKSILELLSSGIWNSINQVGVLLFTGVDLLLGNLFVSAEAMGILALSKTIPNLLSGLSSTIMSSFIPNLTILYAQNDIKSIVKEVNKAGKITLVLIGIPFAGFISFGESFFRLWMPTQNSELIQTLALLSSMGMIYSIGIQPLYQIFTVVNKNKPNSITVLIGGGINILITYLLLQNTSLGLYAICATSSVINELRNFLFTVPFAGNYLGLKKRTFFPLVALTIISITFNCIIGFIFNQIIYIDSWVSFIGTSLVYAMLTFCISLFTILNQDERHFILTKFNNR